MPAVAPAAEDDAAAKPRGRKYWALWSGSMVGTGVVVGVVLVLLMKLVNGPVSATATPDALEAARAAASPTPATNTISGKSVELSYPSVFDAVANKSNDPGAKGDQYYLSTKSLSGRTMVVTAFVLASRKLEDDSSYKFRAMHPELYKMSTMKLGKEQGVIMSRVDKTEVTFFWVHGDRDLNIALTSTDPKDDLAAWMQAMIPTIRWKQ
jgi:hypothetical protein